MRSSAASNTSMRSSSIRLRKTSTSGSKITGMTCASSAQTGKAKHTQATTRPIRPISTRETTRGQRANCAKGYTRSKKRGSKTSNTSLDLRRIRVLCLFLGDVRVESEKISSVHPDSERGDRQTEITYTKSVQTNNEHNVEKMKRQKK